MFTNPYITSQLARDRQREMRAQAAQQRLTRASRKESNRPGKLMIRIAFVAAVLAASAAGTAEAHAATAEAHAATAEAHAATQPHVMSAPASCGRRCHQP
jgi:hypothetical protein